MPNLVGIGLSQVPTNSMLGGLAYQDPEHASIKDLDLKNLSQINSEISDTAVDVFVYDTRKDSDGGAWRKRTQHTSWYNETLGTSTRGTRREFPSVAVLVLQGTVFTIYDGDDPDLPMWMVFNKASNSYFSVTTNSCVTALNGKIVSGGNASNDRLRVIDFLLDNELEYSHTAGRRTHLNPISGRNGTAGFTAYDSSLPGIVNRYVNDVAMTVLPNAPIDDATGLPIPTIAVATNGGVSVIKDDGTVASSSGDAAGLVEYLDNNYIIITRNNNTGYFAVHNDHFTSGSWNANANSYYSATTPAFNQSGYINGLAASENGYFGNNIGLHIYDALSSSSTNTNGLFSNITASYNTGYMVGDIKGAFLSDTDTTNVTGSEKIANHDFSADFSTQWEAVNNANTSYDATNDRVTVTSTQNYSGIQLKSASLPTLTAGKRYIMTVDIHSITNPIYFGVVSGLTVSNVNAAGVWTGVFTASNVTEVFIKKPTGSNSTFVLNSVSIREAEEDRSLNNNGLQVFGTIDKSAVATGADLVAYKGTTASTDRLEQPYNSDLDFGTGDFSIMFWIRGDANPAAWQRMFERKGGENFLTIRIHPQDSGTYQGEVMFKFGSAGWAATNYSIVGKGWLCMVFTRVSGTSKMYVNGVEEYSTTSHNGTVNNGSNGFMIDNNSIRLSLLRVSASAPSLEQIKKMYEDEKVLFQENAKATLYGSSDAVTALAYDEDTELLHVGTSSGRSEFQGLRRINNTTTAVTTAISASNGLVAEQ